MKRLVSCRTNVYTNTYNSEISHNLFRIIYLVETSMKAIRLSAKEKIAKEKEEDRQRMLARLADIEKKAGVDYFTKKREEHEVSKDKSEVMK